MNVASQRKHSSVGSGSGSAPQRTSHAHRPRFEIWLEQLQAHEGQARAGDPDYGCVEWFIYHESRQDEPADD